MTQTPPIPAAPRTPKRDARPSDPTEPTDPAGEGDARNDKAPPNSQSTANSRDGERQTIGQIESLGVARRTRACRSVKRGGHVAACVHVDDDRVGELTVGNAQLDMGGKRGAAQSDDAGVLNGLNDLSR